MMGWGIVDGGYNVENIVVEINSWQNSGVDGEGRRWSERNGPRDKYQYRHNLHMSRAFF